MKKTKVTKTKKADYKASIIVLGKTYSAKGETARDAISKLNPGIAKGKGILIIEVGDVRKEKVLMPMVTQRLFGLSGLSREIQLKNVSLMFDGI